jgi:hypothetical protein
MFEKEREGLRKSEKKERETKSEIEHVLLERERKKE